MGRDMGVVAVVDSLKILRGDTVWRQKNEGYTVPIKPGEFNLGGERARPLVVHGAEGGFACATPSSALGCAVRVVVLFFSPHLGEEQLWVRCCLPSRASWLFPAPLPDVSDGGLRQAQIVFPRTKQSALVNNTPCRRAPPHGIE